MNSILRLSISCVIFRIILIVRTILICITTQYAPTVIQNIRSVSISILLIWSIIAWCYATERTLSWIFLKSCYCLRKRWRVFIPTCMINVSYILANSNEFISYHWISTIPRFPSASPHHKTGVPPPSLSNQITTLPRFPAIFHSSPTLSKIHTTDRQGSSEQVRCPTVVGRLIGKNTTLLQCSGVLRFLPFSQLAEILPIPTLPIP